MAGWKGHITGALVCNAGFVALLTIAPHETIQQTAGLLTDLQLLIGLFVVAALFGLWPDVDTNSKGQNIFFGIAFAADIALILSGRLEAAAYLGLVAMTPIVGKHRGWTHSKWAMILVPSPLIILPYLYRMDLITPAVLVYGAAVVGYFSHLLLDGLIWKRFRIKT